MAKQIIYTYIYIHMHISSIESRPSIKQLQEVMRINDIDMTTQWYELGIQLIESTKTLKAIKSDHQSDINTCCYMMFDKWLEVAPEASWNKLINALHNIEMNTAAIRVQEYLLQVN